MKEKHINFAVNIWLTVGLVQILWRRDFLVFLINRSSTSLDRGVTSLAVEPTYFATVIIFILMVAYLTSSLSRRVIFKCIICILVLASSATGLGLLIIGAILHELNHSSKKSFLLLGLLSIFTYALITYSDMRIGVLMRLFISDPISILTDESANARINSFIYPIVLSMQNYFIPYGIGNYRSNVIADISFLSEHASPYFYWILTNKIMSGFGQMIYELGFICLVYVYAMYRVAKRNLNSVREASLFTIFFFIVLSTAVPLAFPLVGVMYGVRTKTNTKY